MVRRSVEDGKAIQDEGFELAEDILDEVQDSLQIIIVRGSVEDGQSIQDENFEQKEDYQVKGMPFNDREISHSMTIGRGVKESCSCVETQGSVQGAQTVQNDVPDANKTPLGIVEVGKLDVSRAERKTPIGLDKDLNQVLKACDSTYLRTNITTLINLVNKMPYNNDTEMFLTHSDWRGQSEMKFVCIVIRKYMIGSLEASDYIIFTHLYKRIVPAVPDCLVLLSGLLPHSEEFTDTTISYELKELVETAFVWKILKSGYLKIENKRLYIK
ncbi:unnamed protein product [Auanema sp. JU1783]|nr:unnamed protein product [Auanema sp. JU1783]